MSVRNFDSNLKKSKNFHEYFGNCYWPYVMFLDPFIPFPCWPLGENLIELSYEDKNPPYPNAQSLNRALCLRRVPYFERANNEGSGEIVRIHNLL